MERLSSSLNPTPYPAPFFPFQKKNQLKSKHDDWALDLTRLDLSAIGRLLHMSS